LNKYSLVWYILCSKFFIRIFLYIFFN